MNKTIVGIVSVAVAIILVGGIVAFLSRGHSRSNTGSTAGTTFPVGGTSSTSNSTGMTVASTNGSLVVRDFLNDPGVIHNPNNNVGYHILVGSDDPSAPTPPYEIDYSAKDQSFGITLYKEPLGNYRKLAEQDLMRRLGISKSQMCTLNYILAAGPGVNDAYTGQNLRFSFCPDAVQLPY